MYDFDQMHEILTEMADSPAGEKIIYARLGMSPDEQKLNHQVELLSDMGLVTWKSEAIVRITANGYHYLQAFKESSEENRSVMKEHFSQFIEFLDKGVPVLEAFNNIMEMFK